MAQQIKITQTSNADMNIGIPKQITMAQQTAVDYLMNELKSHLEVEWPMNIWLRKKLEQAKQMEKEQIKKAIMWGTDIEAGLIDRNFKIHVEEQYYNETYGENKD